jgi:chemotaxis signal transduction protein
MGEHGDRRPPSMPNPGSGGVRSGSGSGSGSGAGRSAGRGQRGARAGQYVCVFWLGREPYALDAVLVREVVAVPGLLPVALTPAWLLGLCNLRGVALAVVDLGGALDLPTRPAAPAGASGTVVLVLRPGDMLVGLRIDRVEAVYRFDQTRLEASATVSEHVAVKGLLWFAGRGGFTATLLDEEKVSAGLKGLRFSGSGPGRPERNAATGGM